MSDVVARAFQRSLDWLRARFSRRSIRTMSEDERAAEKDYEDVRQLRAKRFTSRLVQFPIFLLLLLIIWIAIGAVRSTAVVIEPFRVPPDLEKQGLSGQVLANHILDEMVRLREENEANAQYGSDAGSPVTYQNSWDGDVAVEIPNTGLSLGEASQILRRLLGRERHIKGEVTVPAPNRLAVTVRLDGFAGRTETGSHTELPDLVRRAAWSVLEETQPLDLAVYLNTIDERARGNRIFHELVATGEPAERKWSYWGLGVSHWQSGNFALVEKMTLAALRIDPAMGEANFNLGKLHVFFGKPEEALKFFRRAVDGEESRSGEARGSGAPLRPERLKEANAEIGFLQRNGTLTLRLLEELEESEFEDTRKLAAEYLPYAQAILHDPASMEVAAGASACAGSACQTRMFELEALLLGALSIESEAVATLASALAEAGAKWRAAAAAAPEQFRQVATRRAEVEVTRGTLPLAVSALASQGAVADARRLAPGMNRDCYACILARASIAVAEGDRKAAAALFERAANSAPNIPDAYQQWGEMLAAAGRPNEAVGKFAAASRTGPRWADPVKTFGDALYTQGKLREAALAYAAAADRAPRWGKLHMVWADALWRTGRRSDAVDKLKAAASMTLSGRDATRLRWMIAEAQRRSSPAPAASSGP